MTDPALPADDQSLPPARVDGGSPPEPLQQILSSDSSSGGVLDLIATDLPEAPEELTFEPRWYLGIAEAIAWFIGTLGVHLVSGIFFMVIMLIAVRPHGKGPQDAMKDPRVMLGATAGEMVCFVLAAMIAVTARYWGRTFKELNMSQPDLRHIMIVVLGTIPLSRVVSLWSIPVQWGWNYVADLAPILKILDQMNTMEAVKDLAAFTSLPVMILVIAVLPAIGEEIIFRGAIGRVLICHIGLWAGLLMTSFLFGLIHIHPVHAVTVMPLGLAIHLLYLGSRSFWIPMLLHFENNTLASIMTKLGANSADAAGAPITLRDGIQLGSALVAVIAFGIALWQSRIRYLNTDGIESDSSLFPTTVPDSTFSRQSKPMGPVCLMIGLVSAIVCHGGLAMEILDPAQNPDRLPIKEAKVTWVIPDSARHNTDEHPAIITIAATACETTRFQ